ncbi:MAG: hypothetical protein L6Q98_19860 [Anaerolineae bacterium]|nr:hypothetical protein [Anaerolineae bacterium]NUQ06715.1 hypothetical protein [Anaerolineae bacterium]
MNDNRGLYTVAYGAPARECAQRLLESWERHMRATPALVATDEAAAFDVSTVTLPRPDIGAREPKLRMYEVTPPAWDVLYLDADVEIMQPVHFFFEALEAGFDLVLTRNPGKYHTTREMARPNNRVEVEATWRLMGGDDLLQWNGGVVAFRRSPEVERFFGLWLAGWREARNQDQPALHRALWAQPLRVLTLGSEWNCSTRYSDGREREIVRHHQTEAREMQTKLPPGVAGDSDQAWRMLRKDRT